MNITQKFMQNPFVKKLAKPLVIAGAAAGILVGTSNSKDTASYLDAIQYQQEQANNSLKKVIESTNQIITKMENLPIDTLNTAAAINTYNK